MEGARKLARGLEFLGAPIIGVLEFPCYKRRTGALLIAITLGALLIAYAKGSIFERARGFLSDHIFHTKRWHDMTVTLAALPKYVKIGGYLALALAIDRIRHSQDTIFFKKKGSGDIDDLLLDDAQFEPASTRGLYSSDKERREGRFAFLNQLCGPRDADRLTEESYKLPSASPR